MTSISKYKSNSKVLMSHYNIDKIPKKTRSADLNCGNYAKQWENVKLICCFCRLPPFQMMQMQQATLTTTLLLLPQ